MAISLHCSSPSLNQQAAISASWRAFITIKEAMVKLGIGPREASGLEKADLNWPRLAPASSSSLIAHRYRVLRLGLQRLVNVIEEFTNTVEDRYFMDIFCVGFIICSLIINCYFGHIHLIFLNSFMNCNKSV